MNMKTLNDGRQVASDSDEWRHECEAREILGWPAVRRRDFLEGYQPPGDRAVKGVKGNRGQEAVTALKETVLALWITRHAERLADLGESERAERLQKLRADNREPIMRRIEAQLQVALERRRDAAENKTKNGIDDETKPAASSI